MKKIVPALLLLTLASCHYFEKNVPNEKELLDKRLKEIDWKNVDQYPSVPDCDSLSDPEMRKQCFFDYLTANIQQKLDTITPLRILYPNLDTIEVRVTVMPDASVQFEPEFSKDSVAYDTIKIDSILRTRLADFPKINPAVKSGIPVKTQFILPVIIKKR